MKRRVRSDLHGMLAKVLSPETDLLFEETWSSPDDGGRTGKLTMDAVGQPVKMTAEFELVPSGKGCLYRITHKCTASVPLIGGLVAKCAQEQVEKGCADEFAYLVESRGERCLVPDGYDPADLYRRGAQLTGMRSAHCYLECIALVVRQGRW